jgi:phospholipase C
MVTARYDTAKGDILLTLENPTGRALDCTIRDNAYGMRAHSVRLAPGARAEQRVGLERSAQWYDLTITAAEAPDWSRRLAGHVETGRLSSSDPAATVPALFLSL